MGEMFGSESDAATNEAMSPQSSEDSSGMRRRPDIVKVNYYTVTPTTEVVFVPRPPEPYETWSDTWSYTDPNEYEMFKGEYKEYKK